MHLKDNFRNFQIKKKKHKTTRCGAIVFNQNLNKIILVLNKYLYDEQNIELWGLPKGLLESRENFNECAMREVKEETGINIRIKKSQPYLKLNNNYYFPIKINENELQNLYTRDNNEIEKVKWFTIKDLNNLKLNKDLKSLTQQIYRAKNIAKLFDTYEKKNFVYYSN